uniref:Pentatricopeptide repeat-containing protein At1g55890, mitochondrial-like n=1 Tax=Nicotiana tabacum TaxID=4097 RepID=A0A1S3Y5P7_TOBAC|nr:PREDICTED: pentatricopeptide repeat-containing protein At1g55890, mitochondrial-like [Nicotiana tabacum]
MSTFSTIRRLRGIFTGDSHKAATKTIDLKITKPTNITSSNHTVQDIVNLMKESSKCPKFRREGRGYYELAIHRLARAKHFSGIEEIIEHQKHYPDIRHEPFVRLLILLYGKARMFDHARKLFDEMPQLNCQRSVFTFNALLESCIRSERYDEIGELFRELPAKLEIEPNVVSYNLAIKALCKAGSLDSALLLMDVIEKHGIKPNIVTCNTLLNALYGSQRFAEAENLWIVMENRNIVPDLCSYNIRLRGLIKVHEVSKAIQFFEEIINKGFKPDKFSYNTMITMCVDEGNLEEAKMWYQKMVQNGCLPVDATFHMLIPLACDAKKFEFALHLCKKAIESQVLVYREIMQRVIDGLFEHSEIENAKELVKLAKSCNFHYELWLPLHS